MEDYTYEYGDYGTHTLRVTLQYGKYKGNIAYEVGGNISGLDVLKIDADDLAWVQDFKENTCEFNTEDDGFSVILSDDEGNQLLIDEEYDELERYVVSVEIIGYERED